jgi:CRP-like cAMP-binding protein
LNAPEVHDMADFLDAKVKEIDERLRELKPLVDEHARLEKARQALSGVGGNGRRSGARAATTRTSTGRRRGRPRGGNTRTRQTLELVRTRPGITIPELAESMKIKPNYLYRILPGLEKDGQVRKEGKGWHAAG